MSEPRTIVFPGCVVKVWPDYLETVFPDRLKVPAGPNFDEQSLKTAADLGYQTTWEMSRDHEFCHTFLMVKLGLDFSPTLRGVALRLIGKSKEDYISKLQSDWEEELVFAFQRVINGQEPRRELGVLLAREHDLGDLVDELRGLIHG